MPASNSGVRSTSRPSRRLINASAFLLLVLSLFSPSVRAQGGITWIGPYYSLAMGVSSDGNFVTGTGIQDSAHWWDQAWRWDGQGSLKWLGWPSLGFVSETDGTEISADGNTIVGYYQSQGPLYAFRWTSGSGMQVLNTGGKECYITGMDSLAHVICANGLGYGAASWTNGIWSKLPTTAHVADAEGVSSEGSVIVGYETDTVAHAIFPVYWTGGTVRRFSTTQALAQASSSHGNVIVGCTRDQKAFRWTPSGGMEFLGDSTNALAVSADGSTIVGLEAKRTGNHALIWHNGSTVARRLEDVASDNGIFVGGTLSIAWAVSADGSVIVGGGQDEQDNQYHAYQLVLKKTITVQRPVANQLWLAGKTDTIRWTPPTSVLFVDLFFSTDDGTTWQVIDQNIQANTREYVYTIDTTVLSAKCRFRVRESSGTTQGESGTFRVKGIYLTRFDADGQYEKFDQGIHGYQFGNTRDAMWPRSWWSRYHYNGGIDEVTGNPYPTAGALAEPFISAVDSTFPSWPLWVKVFGPDQCYFSLTGELTRKVATDRWKTYRGRWGGSCFGIAYSSLLAFDDQASFRYAFPDMPPFTNLIDLPCDDNVRWVINQIMTAQLGNTHWETYGQRITTVSPTQTV